MRPNLSGWMIHSYIVQTELLFLRTYIRQVTQLAEGNLNTGLDANLSHLCLNNIRWVSGVKGRKRREEGVGRRKELVQQIKRSHKQATHISVLLALSMWSRQWHPTPVLLPGKSHGRRSLEGRSPWGCWGSDTTERLHFHFSLFTFMHWRRKWHPTPVFLPGESQGQGSLVGCRLWGRTESDMTEAT